MLDVSSHNRLFDFIRYKIRHNYRFEDHLRYVERVHSLSRTQRDELNNELFLQIFRRAFRHSAFYRDHYQRHGITETTIRSLDDLAKLPIVTKEDIKQNNFRIVTASPRFLHKAYTGGTSGSTALLYRDWNSILLENAYLWHYRNCHGLRQKDPVVSIRGDLNVKTRSHYNRSENILYLSSFTINEKTIGEYHRLISDFSPKAFWGYPSSLEILANEFQKAGLSVNVPLAFTSSETLQPFQREKIQQTLGAFTYDWYGNSERSVAMEQCRQGTYHFVPGYGVAEVKPDRILSTGFINPAFPFIRYELDDALRINPGRQGCCGDSVLTAEAIEGRQEDKCHLPDGTTIGLIGFAFVGILTIEYMQFVQDRIDELTVNIVKGPGFTKADELKFVSKLRSEEGIYIPIKVNYVTPQDIIRTKAGKFKFFINRMGQS